MGEIKIKKGSVKHRNVCSSLKIAFETEGRLDPSQSYPQKKSVAKSLDCEEIGFDVDNWKSER